MTLTRSMLPLTRPDPALAHAADITHPGMAHFAGSGMVGMTCRMCGFWGHGAVGGVAYFAAGGQHYGQIKPARCLKFTQLMNGTIGAKVPDDAAACRHFEPHRNPPARFRKAGQ